MVAPPASQMPSAGRSVEPAAPAIAAPSTDTPAGATEPASEAEQREQIERDIAALPGVVDAGWATRSTLVVHLMPDATDDQIDGVCEVLERSESLGASRVQLQPAPSSRQPSSRRPAPRNRHPKRSSANRSNATSPPCPASSMPAGPPGRPLWCT